MIIAKTNDDNRIADAELISRCQCGDDQSWRHLLERYGSLIYSIAGKCHLPPEDVADVFQSVCLVMLEDLESLKARRNLSAWLATVTLQECRHLVELDQVGDESSIVSETSLREEDVQHLVQSWSGKRAGLTTDDLLAEAVVIETDELSEPPQWLVHQAMNLLEWHRTKPKGNEPKQIPAFLLVDSYAEGQLAGFRSVGPMPRQMLYRAGDYHLNLSINQVEHAGMVHAIDIMGQPLPLNADLGAVVDAGIELVSHSTPTRATKANEFGAFILDGVHEGIYELKIKLKDEEIHIMGLEAIVRTSPKPEVN